MEFLFGEFIAKKRKERGITLRNMAERLGITPPYYSDIEKSRRNPPDMDMLIKIANELGLTEEDRNLMFDYAGRDRKEIAPDLPDYIKNTDIVTVALRKAKDLASEDDWQQFIDKLNRKGNTPND